MKSPAAKERPILFSGPMVRALLAGTKTQTRRIAKFKARDGVNLGFSGLDVGHYCTGVPASGWVLRSRGAGGCWNDRTAALRCPYGLVGDRLWVRETWLTRGNGEITCYRAGVDPVEAAGFGAMYGGWKPSIFMPRARSRLTLEITGIRVERLNAISEDDARAEGVRSKGYYAVLWDEINGGGAYMLDPWVWVVEFKSVNTE